MAKYRVRSGQNIYDVALTLYGSVEGIFDLLSSNRWLNMETQLKYGMELTYHENFVLHADIPMWFNDHKLLVKNGEHICNPIDVESLIKEHIEKEHPDIFASLDEISPDEQNIYWETLCIPRMAISQQGQLSIINFQLKPDRHLIIEWGDYTEPQIFEGTVYKEIEHCYKSSGRHTVTFYGDFEFSLLDLNKSHGIHYPMDAIYADKFMTLLTIESINKLIITQE